MTIILRDYQQDAVESAYAYWQNGTSCIIEAPCGAGKSLIIGKICHDSITHDVRVLVVTHRKKLLEQNYICCKITKEEANEFEIVVSLTKNTLLGFYK